MKWTENDIKKLKESGTIRGYSFINCGNKTQKRAKYGNKKVTIDGIVFDSKKEGNRYYELKMLKLAGLIKDLELQKEYRLDVNGSKVAAYKADFVYVINKTGEVIVEDVKSPATRKIRQYVIKKKMMKAIYGIEIKEI